MIEPDAGEKAEDLVLVNFLGNAFPGGAFGTATATATVSGQAPIQFGIFERKEIEAKIGNTITLSLTTGATASGPFSSSANARIIAGVTRPPNLVQLTRMSDARASVP